MVFYFFLSFQVPKKKKKIILIIAIVCLQYILLQYSLCSICVDNLYVLYIYIYISTVVIKREGSCKNLNSFTVVMQKKGHTNHTCRHNQTKHLTYLYVYNRQDPKVKYFAFFRKNLLKMADGDPT